MTNVLSCPACAADVTPDAPVCPRCRTSLSREDVVTRLEPASSGSGRTTSSSGWLSSGASIDHGRFQPGSLLGGRYRIVGRVGRGGMGEVYRADDLKLGQPVALKFLSSDADRDPARLTQLHTEVRMARQVSHPNVCRVYDIDEVDGHTFLSMEYVDGEDLASLIKRVGRFHEARGLEIARQMCAGLAAAHERGVVHRDFKPANVMLDAGGRVRITDFGLAGNIGESIRAGTPAYMAPEQLAGAEVTPRSDIYALGLVLYEIFTGQRALDGRNLAELIRMREQSGIVPPSAIVHDLNPEIDRAIMRCLRPDPAGRPASALALSAALPGGDPLAAALAAGETPSPEMVAAAGDAAGLSPLAGAALLGFVVAALLAIALVSDRTLVTARLPFDKTADALEDRARDVVARLGYAGGAVDHARGINPNGEVIDYLMRSGPGAPRWDDVGSGAFSTIRFWYRTSPAELVPLAPQWTVALADPPFTMPGMTSVVVDEHGRLTDFAAVPPRVPPAAAAATDVDWLPLFAAAGLHPADFQAAAPTSTPPVFADRRMAWEGSLRGRSDVRVRVEAAAFAGRPVFFTISGPWTRPPSGPRAAEPASSRALNAIGGLLGLLLGCGAVTLARFNVRHSRGDWRGATRLAAVVLAVWAAAWTLGARHFFSLSLETSHFFTFFAFALLNTGTTWGLYLALEPYVRRYCPDILISWARLLAGGLRDERVGRDLLVGVAVGVLLGLTFHLAALAPVVLSSKPIAMRSTGLQFLLGPRFVASAVVRLLPNAMGNAMAATFVFVMLRALLRREWLAVSAALVLFTLVLMQEMGADSLPVRVVLSLMFVVPVLVTLLRFGVLSQITALLVNQALLTVAITLDPAKPYAASGAWFALAIVALAIFGFRSSLAGHRLFGRLLPA